LLEPDSLHGISPLVYTARSLGRDGWFWAVLSNAAAEGKRQRGMAAPNPRALRSMVIPGRASVRTSDVQLHIGEGRDYAGLRKTSSNFRIDARSAPSGMTVVS